MKETKKISSLSFGKQIAKVKISRELGSVADTAFFKKKIEKGAKTLAIAGLPK